MRLPSTFDRLLIVIGLFLISILAALQFLTWTDTRSELSEERVFHDQHPPA